MSVDAPEAPPSRQVVQREAKKPESAGAKVVVYCKMPNGIRIRNFRMVDQREQVMGGGTREFKIAEPTNDEFLINGNRFRLGDPQTHRVIGDYGVTEGVDKDSWDAWLKDNADTPMVKNRLIFAAENKAYGEAEAEDHRDVFSGLGPMGKDGDPRAPKAGANLTGLKDDRAA